MIFFSLFTTKIILQIEICLKDLIFLFDIKWVSGLSVFSKVFSEISLSFRRTNERENSFLKNLLNFLVWILINNICRIFIVSSIYYDNKWKIIINYLICNIYALFTTKIILQIDIYEDFLILLDIKWVSGLSFLDRFHWFRDTWMKEKTHFKMIFWIS